MISDIDAVSEREAELQMAIVDLIEAAELAMFWIDKTNVQGQLKHQLLRGAIVRANKTLLREPGE